MRSFLPSLRGSALPARQTQAVQQAGLQSKAVLLADYYSALVNAGIATPERAKPWDVARAVSEGYERVVWAFKSVEAIAGNSSRLPFRLRDGEDVVEDHPLALVLNHGKANPLETGRQFRKRLSAQILLSKRGAFVEVTKDMRGNVIRLDLLPPARTKPVAGSGQDLISHFAVEHPKGYGPPREIPPERVRWFREPHPLDPYSGITPLEAAGLSIELDYFARLYNVQFMRNDGRPGGIIGVDGEMDELEMDRVEARFGKGPVEAGKLSVINGALTYVDTAAKPRDLQYGATSKNAKIEILVAFGVPESQLGNAADKTFANASEEAEAFWTQTMQNHNDLVVSGFDEDSTDGLEGFLDTTTVEALQRPLVARRLEARDEFTAGLRSIRSYALLAGMGDEIEDTPHTRALYLASGRTPLPSREADAEALGMGPAPDAGTVSAAQVDPGTDGQQPALPPGASDEGGTPALPAGGSAPAVARPYAVRTAESATGVEGAGAPETKVLVGEVLARAPSSGGGGALAPGRVALKVIRGGQASPPRMPRDALPDDRARDALEEALTLALQAVADRMVERTLVRLGSPKIRRGTRLWQAEGSGDRGAGTKALDVDRVVEEARWAEGAEESARPIVEPAAAAAAVALLVALGDEDDGEGGMLERARRIASGAVEAVMRIITASAARQGRLLADALEDRDRAGDDLQALGEVVRGRVAGLVGWARGLATQGATAVTEGARHAGAQDLEQRERVQIDRTWLSRRDQRVRGSHDKGEGGADGQVRPLGEPFRVGGVDVRFPGDPAAPLRETANCFPADTIVGGAAVVAGYRQWYVGPMVTVRTRSGRVLTGTPNHPVLTDRGWVALGGLQVDRDRVQAVVGEADLAGAEPGSSGAPHVQHPPARIDEVYGALAEVGVAQRVSGLSVDFHGYRPAGEVDVVRTDGVLRLDGQPALPEGIGEDVLTESDLRLTSTGGRGCAGELLRATSGTSRGVVGGGGEPSAFVGSGEGQPDALGLTPAALVIDACTAQPSSYGVSAGVVRGGERLDARAVAVLDRQEVQVGNGPAGAAGPAAHGETAAFTQPSVDSRVGDTAGGGEGAQRQGGLAVVAEEVVDLVRAERWSGHVYNLGTLSGYYTASGIIAHNCRCRLLYRRRGGDGRFITRPPGVDGKALAWDVKVARYVRTAEGEAQYGLPRGALIVRDAPKVPAGRAGGATAGSGRPAAAPAPPAPDRATQRAAPATRPASPPSYAFINRQGLPKAVVAHRDGAGGGGRGRGQHRQRPGRSGGRGHRRAAR